MDFFQEWELFRIMSPVSHDVIENIGNTSVVHVNQDLHTQSVHV